MSIDWDPAHYLRYADHRTRPGIELIARIPDGDYRSIVDLGCGTGHLTALLAARFPEATVVGVDSSPAMIAEASSNHEGIRWDESDISVWEPDSSVDLVFSNAALHWLENHDRLIPRIRGWVRARGSIAIQMPDNWTAPTHRIPASILADGGFPVEARHALLSDPVAEPADYRGWLQPATVDLWTTTYHQVLTGPDPVWNWVTGSVLRPVLQALDGTDRSRFESACVDAYRQAYPPTSDGTTLLPFRRFFVVASVR